MISFNTFYLKEKTINAKQMGSLPPPEDEHLMKQGKDLADKYGLKFNGWWEISHTFTDPKTGNTFLAKNEEELVQKLKKLRPNESVLHEMPHEATKDYVLDFKMEKSGWPARMVKYIHIVGKDKVDELLEPFYGMYGIMFKAKFNRASEEEKNLLRRKLPKQFLSDMGVE